MTHTSSFWITGATNGLGLALVIELLKQGHRVAASCNDSHLLDTLTKDHGERFLPLPWQLYDHTQATEAAAQVQAVWGALDALIINAGTCDYLAPELPDDKVLEAIVTSNRQASSNCLMAAAPLLANGSSPQVMAILSRYSAMQLHHPNQPLNASNSLTHWFREQRQALQAHGIGLTVVAPQSLQAPVTAAHAIPEQWTAETAAQVLVSSLRERESELVLEVWSLSSLWPLPR